MSIDESEQFSLGFPITRRESRGVILIFTEKRRSPETQNPPQRAGSVSRQAGEYLSSGDTDNPRKPEPLQAFFGDGEALSKSSLPLRRVALQPERRIHVFFST
jgi:hypothetical protein